MDVKETKAPAPKPPGTQKQNKKIVILRAQSKLYETNTEELEKKYAEKFGCKVVILESNLEMVDVING